MVEIRPEPRHACQGIADCARQWRFSRDTGELGVQPDFQIIEDWLCLFLSRSAHFFLDRVELRDVLDGFIGNDRTLSAMWKSTNLRLAWAMQATSWISPEQ